MKVSKQNGMKGIAVSMTALIFIFIVSAVLLLFVLIGLAGILPGASSNTFYEFFEKILGAF